VDEYGREAYEKTIKDSIQVFEHEFKKD